MEVEQEISQETEESQSLPLLIMASTPAFPNGHDEGVRRHQDPTSSENRNISDETDYQISGNLVKYGLNDEGGLNRPRKKLGYHFDCNICLESVEDPVVTRCGHLYCWPCLYKWLEPGISSIEKKILFLNSSYNHDSAREEINLLQNGIPGGVRNENDERDFDPIRQSCPVCKAKCNLSSIVPIYVKNTKRKCTLSNKEEEISQDGTTNQSKTPPRPNPFVQYPNTSSAIRNNNNNNESSNIAMRIPAPPLLSQSVITSSSFDQSIVPVLLGFPDMASQHSPPGLIARSRSLSSNSEVSPEEQREYLLMEDASTNFLSNILLLMGSTVIFILFIF